MDMIILDVVQGSEAWLAEKADPNTFSASEAPVMMGVSKHTKRRELLQEKKTGRRKEASDYQKNVLFAGGHATERKDRAKAELKLGADLFPTTAYIMVDGMRILASFDGLSESREIWEGKDWNKTLWENVCNNVLEPLYYWQLEQQMLVANTNWALFSCSDGNGQFQSMVYHSVPDRREQLIAGWKHFKQDLDAFVVEAKQELVVPVSRTLPVVKWKLDGSMIVSNIQAVVPIVKELAQEEMAKILETDQDFADKDDFNKKVVEARKKMKDTLATVRGEFVSYAEFETAANELDVILQKLQSNGESAVKVQKEKRKQAIQQTAEHAYQLYYGECFARVRPVDLRAVPNDINPDFSGVMKNKRTLESLQNAVDAELVRLKLALGTLTDLVANNLTMLDTLTAGTDHGNLFFDLNTIVAMPLDGFTAIVKQRIAEHVAAEQKKADDLRETIRLEEEKKAQAQAEALAESERARIRKEEEQKARDKAAEENRLKAEETERLAHEEGKRAGATQSDVKTTNPVVAKPEVQQAASAQPPATKTRAARATPTYGDVVRILSTHYEVGPDVAAAWLDALIKQREAA